ncbi:outer membrane protein [Sphingomonas sp. CJ20]
MNAFRITLAATAMAASAPAFAQEATDFAGPRVDASIGLDQLRFDLASVGQDGRAKQSDLGYGLTIGYDAAVAPRVLLGIEGGVNLSDNHYVTGDATTGGELRQRRELTLAGRIGTPLTANTLLYGKVGYANLQVREDQTVAGVTASDRRDLDGVLLGTGIEVKMSPTTYWKSEYRYTNYADGVASNKVTTGVGIRF